MILTVSFDDKTYDLDVPEKLIADAQDFYSKMNKDMDQGWQVSREWIDNPNVKQRCQIVADKILNAFHDENEQLVLLMAGYILSQMNGVLQISIDTTGDITQTEFNLKSE